MSGAQRPTASLPPQMNWRLPTPSPSPTSPGHHKRERRQASLPGSNQPAGLQDPTLLVSWLRGLPLGPPWGTGDRGSGRQGEGPAV